LAGIFESAEKPFRRPLSGMHFGSITRRPHPDHARIRIDVAAGRIVIHLRAVRVGGRVRLHIGSRAGDVA
jgi:hypothetical protein